MSDFVLDVTRADDLLKLRLEFTNLALDPDETRVPRRLVRKSRGEDAFMTVFFPPQHISEFSFTEKPDGTLDRLPHPGHRVRVFSAGESRLGFRLRSDLDSIALTLDELLDWTRFEPVLAVTDASSGNQDQPPREVSEPLATETAIELPFRIMLSPEQSANWLHNARPVVHDGRIELWHTRLVPAESQVVAPQLWAIWSPDMDTPAANDFPMSLTADDRRQIVPISSDFKLLDSSNFSHLDPDEIRELETLQLARRQRLAGEQLILSAYGGWLKAFSSFNFPSVGGLLHLMKGHEMDPGSDLFSLQEWAHVAIMGRDQYVRVVKRGFMFPFGHRADLTIITERKFKRSRDRDVFEEPAYLTHKSFLTVQEPERTYNTRDTPFQSVRMSTLLTSSISNVQKGFFIPKIGDQNFAFPVSATDQQGNVIDAALPMVFVPTDQVNQLTDIAAAYQNINRIDVRSQPIAFAKGDAESVLKTVAISFQHAEAADAPPFRPIMQQAEVCLSVAEQFLGKPLATTIAYDPIFVQPNVQQTVGDVFANIIDESGLKLELPADKVGGIAAPTQTLRALSRTFGAVPALQAIGNDFAPANLDFLNDARLLGVVSLTDAIESITRSVDMPKFVTVTEANGHKIEFTWKPPMKGQLPEPLVSSGDDKPTLELKGSISRPPTAGRFSPSDAVSDIEGTLTNFGVVFLDTVQVNFKSLHFHMVTHQKPDFGADIKDFKFLGQLAFINQLADCLPKQGFGAPGATPSISTGDSPGGSGPVATLTTTPEGVTAGVALAVPNVSLGALALQNLALGAQLSLLFTKPAELRFGLSSREHPFLISYSLLGGGGFFAMTVTTQHGDVDLEASLEFGAVAAIDIFIAKGEVQAMVGVYFSIKSGAALLEGFIRLYGCVEILEIVTISVEFYLSLSYDGHNATGTASLTVMVRVLMFSKSVTLTVTRSFSTDSISLFTAGAKPARTFAETVSLDQWTAYCNAFAPE
jgi:hypothetical protein